jgi:acetylornithine deacetylase/succinyl-diaminopimelate desuccinylase-like protein
MPPTAIALLQELIRIPSVNPDGEPGTPHVGEKEIAGYVGGFLRQLGAEVELSEVLPDRPNVIGRFPAGPAGKPKLLLAPHLDTVSIGGMTIDPFGGEIRDGKIWGRGSSDTKGSLAAMLWALKESDVSDLPYEIWFAGLMGEEAGLYGSIHLAANSKFDFVIVGEPTGLQIVHATKGSSWHTLRTRGTAVHASAPELGENAIYKMADVVACIRNEIAPALAALRHPLLGSPSISVGTVRGGTKVNVVPDACEACVDLRTIPDQDLEPVFRRLREVCPDLEIESWQAKPMFTDPDHPVIHALERCGAGCTTAAWFCDAASFAEQGIPAVAVGPGSIAQAHTKDEFLAVADLEAGVEFFKRFFKELAAG